MKLSLGVFVAVICSIFTRLVALEGWVSNDFSTDTNIAPTLPQVAFNADGTKAFAVWQAQNGASYLPRVAIYSSGSWSSSNLTSQASTGYTFPKIAIASDGTKAFAIWQSQISAVYHTRSSIYSSGSWSGSSILTTETSVFSTFPQIAASSDGTKAFAVWQIYDGSNYIPHASIYTSIGWTLSDSTLPSSADAGTDSLPQIAVSANGDTAITVAQRKLPDGPYNAMASVYSSGSWSATQQYDSLNATIPQVALSAEGNKGIMVWSGTLDESFNYAEEATFSGSWSTSFLPPTDRSLRPVKAKIAISTNGAKAIAVWEVFDDILSNYTPHAAVYSSGSWISKDFSSPTSASSTVPQIALSADGTKAFAVWQTFNGAHYTPHAAIFSSDNWTSKDFSSPSSTSENLPQIAVNADASRAVAVWQTSKDEIYTSHAAFYGPISPTPPSNLLPPASAKGKRLRRYMFFNYKLFRSGFVYSNKLFWEASPSPNVTRYRIYKGEKKVVTVKATVFKYVIKPVDPYKKNVYKIVSVDKEGNESPPIKVKVKKKKTS